MYQSIATLMLLLLLSYLVGSIPFSLVIGKLFFKKDVRNYGSGNLGGTNTGRILGKKAGLVCDEIILVGKNRSNPLADGVKSTAFDTENLFVADSFKNAMEIYSSFADSNTVVLLENDLPDNYLN